MTDYGQLLPNRVVHLTNQNNVSKARFTHIFARALVQLGMVPISSWNTYDATDPANAEFGTPGQASYPVNLFFDFPTAETFTVDGIPYRPCLSIHAHSTDDSNQTNNSINYWFKAWGLHLGVRRADRLQLGDFRTSTYFRESGANFGNRTSTTSENVSTYKFGMHRRFKEGSQFEQSAPYWLPFAGSSLTQPTQVAGHNFKSIYLYLGKAGLFCFVGSSLTGPGFGSILSAGIMFAGGRIPGRGRVPAQDPNLNRINPTIELPMFNGVHGTDYWDGGTLRNPILHMQHDLKVFNTFPVLCYIYNLENLEQPISPSGAPHVLRSPRLVNGAGSFILSRPVIVPQFALNDYSKYAGPVDVQITGQAVRPQWADVFTAQNFRFGDRTTTTPIEYTDPLTSKKWFLVYAENTNMAYALDYDGRTIATALVPAQTRVLYETIDVNFSVVGLTGPFPTGVSVSTGGTAPAWVAVAGQNELQLVLTATQATNRSVNIFYTPPLTDSATTTYVFEVETKAPRTAGVGTQRNDVYAFGANGSAILLYSQTLTTSTIAPEFNYQSFIRDGAVNSNTGQVQFQLNYYSDTNFTTGNPRMRNFKIKKYMLV